MNLTATVPSGEDRLKILKLINETGAGGVFARDLATTELLIFGMHAGRVPGEYPSTDPIEVPESIHDLEPEALNYIEINPHTGDITVNQEAWSEGLWQLYLIETNEKRIVNIFDRRQMLNGGTNAVTLGGYPVESFATQEDLDTEISERITADEDLQEAVDSKASNNALVAEITTRADAINNLLALLGDETSDRITALLGKADLIAGYIDINQIPVSLLGALRYQTSWNALTNSPDIAASSPIKGQYWIVSVAGSTSLGGITDWQLGDHAVYNGSVWEKYDYSQIVYSAVNLAATDPTNSNSAAMLQTVLDNMAALLPTVGQKAALAGTGTPSGSNKFVTENSIEDTALTAQDPTVGGTPQTAIRTIFTNLLALITGKQNAYAADTPNKFLATSATTGNIVPSLRALVAADLPDSGATAGTFGSSVVTPIITVDAKGRITVSGSTTVVPNRTNFTQAQTANGFSLGSVVRPSTTANTYVLAQADTMANAESAVLVTIAGTNSFGYSVAGTIVSIVGFTGLTTGTTYYLSQTTPGAYTATKPTTGIIKPLFIAVATNQLMILNVGAYYAQQPVSMGGTGADMSATGGTTSSARHAVFQDTLGGALASSLIVNADLPARSQIGSTGLVDAATVAVALSGRSHFVHSASVSRIIGAPSSGGSGQPIEIQFRNTGASPIQHTLTTGASGWRFPTGITAMPVIPAGGILIMGAIWNTVDSRMEVTWFSYDAGAALLPTTSTTLDSTSPIVGADATSGAITLTLPTDPTTARRYVIYKKDSSANIVTITAGGTNTFDGNGQTRKLFFQNDFILLEADTTGVWRVLNFVINGHVPLTDASTIAVDCSLIPRNNGVAKVTLAGNRTLGAFTNYAKGQKITLVVKQDATGGRTLTPTTGSAGAQRVGTAPVMPTTLTANKQYKYAFMHEADDDRFDLVGVVGEF